MLSLTLLTLLAVTSVFAAMSFMCAKSDRAVEFEAAKHELIAQLSDGMSVENIAITVNDYAIKKIETESNCVRIILTAEPNRSSAKNEYSFVWTKDN